MSAVNSATSPNINTASTSAIDLRGTTGVGSNQANDDQLDAGTNREDPRNIRRDNLNIQVPKPTGTVTNSISPTGGFNQTITNGAGTTVNTSRPTIGSPASVTGVSQQIPLGQNSSATIRATPGSVGASISGKQDLGGGVSVNGSAGITQPLNGTPATTTVTGGVTAGNTSVSATRTNAPNGASTGITATQQFNNGNVGAGVTLPSNGPASINVSGEVRPNSDVTVGGSINYTPDTGEVRGSANVRWNF